MRFSVFVCVAVVAALAIAPIGAAAVVQEDATNATDDEQTELEQQLNDSEIKEMIDPTLAITDWQYKNERFTLTLESTESQEIVAAEAIRAEEGTGRMTWDTYRIDEGTNTIEIPVRSAKSWTNKGAAVTIASDRSSEAGHATYISNGMIEPDREPVGYQVTQIMVILSALGGAGYAFRRVRSKYSDEDKGADRIA